MTSIPSITCPNTTWFLINIIQKLAFCETHQNNLNIEALSYPSKWGAAFKVTKNYDPFVFLPELAIDKRPAQACLLERSSSAKCFP